MAVDATGLAPGAISTFYVWRTHNRGGEPMLWRRWLISGSSWWTLIARWCWPNVEDGIEDFTDVVKSRATSGFGGGEVWLKVGPLGIGEVGEICCSHAR